MIITLTVVALLIQFVCVYILLIRAQREQDKPGEEVEPANQRGRQAYYNAFGSRRPGERA